MTGSSSSSKMWQFKANGTRKEIQTNIPNLFETILKLFLTHIQMRTWKTERILNDAISSMLIRLGWWIMDDGLDLDDDEWMNDWLIDWRNEGRKEGRNEWMMMNILSNDHCGRMDWHTAISTLVSLQDSTAIRCSSYILQLITCQKVGNVLTKIGYKNFPSGGKPRQRLWAFWKKYCFPPVAKLLIHSSK